MLAAGFEISEARALQLQAGIWNVPVAGIELNAYNPTNQKPFDIGQAGQKTLQIQQLIYMGGKKKKEVEWASKNVDIAAIQLEDLLRELKFQLHSTYCNLYFNQMKIEVTQKQVNQIDTLISRYRVQMLKNNVPMKDLYRLQSLYLRISENLKNLKQIETDEMNKLKLICGTDKAIVVRLDNLYEVINKNENFNLEEPQLLELAKSNHPKFKLIQKMLESDSLYLVWQRSINTPDVNLGLAYDQRGGAFNNQIGVTLEIPLNLWQPNRGNIELAKARWSKQAINAKFSQEQLKNEIHMAVVNFNLSKENYTRQKNVRMDEYNLVYNGMISNFMKGNIGMLEFIDFMESYYDTNELMNDNLRSFYIAGELINYNTNTNLMNQ